MPSEKLYREFQNLERKIQLVLSENSRLKEDLSQVRNENGMLKDRDVDRPSEFLALVTLPIEVSRSVMTILTDFIQLRVDHSSAETQSVEAQTKQLEALELLKDAVEAQSSSIE